MFAVCSEIHTEHINTLCGQNVELLKATISFTSLRPSVRPQRTTRLPLGKFPCSWISEYFSKICYKKFPVSLKSDKNNGYFN